MFQINLRSQQSIYEQIIDNIKELIIRGVLEEDSLPELPELDKNYIPAATYPNPIWQQDSTKVEEKAED